MRVLAISDIHGQSTALQQLLRAIQYNPTTDKLFFCGDYIGKGPDAEGVLNIVYKAVQQGAVAILGNHEYDYLRTNIRRFSPRIHQFVESMPFYAVFNCYLFVHAGIRSGIPLELQKTSDLIRIREGFLDVDLDCKETVIFGHTPTDRLHGQVGKVWIKGNKIGIDTGAGQQQYLSLVDLTNRQQHRVHILTNSYDVISF